MDRIEQLETKVKAARTLALADSAGTAAMKEAEKAVDGFYVRAVRQAGQRQEQ